MNIVMYWRDQLMSFYHIHVLLYNQIVSWNRPFLLILTFYLRVAELSFLTLSLWRSRVNLNIATGQGKTSHFQQTAYKDRGLSIERASFQQNIMASDLEVLSLMPATSHSVAPVNAGGHCLMRRYHLQTGDSKSWDPWIWRSVAPSCA